MAELQLECRRLVADGASRDQQSSLRVAALEMKAKALDLEVEELRGSPVRHANTTEQLWAFAKATQLASNKNKNKGNESDDEEEEEDDLEQISVLVTAVVAIDLWELFNVLTSKAHDLAVLEANEKHRQSLFEQQEEELNEQRRHLEEETSLLKSRMMSLTNNQLNKEQKLQPHIEENEEDVRQEQQGNQSKQSHKHRHQRRDGQEESSSSSSSGESSSESSEDEGETNRSSKSKLEDSEWEKWAKAQEAELKEEVPIITEPEPKTKIWRRRGTMG